MIFFDDSFVFTWFILTCDYYTIHLFWHDSFSRFILFWCDSLSRFIYFHLILTCNSYILSWFIFVIFFHTLIIYHTWLTDFDVIFSPTWLIFSHDFWNDSFIFHMILSHCSFIWNVSFIFHMIHYFIELINHLFSNYSFPPCYFKPCVSGHVLLTRITHVITCDVECVWLFRKRRDVEEIQEQLRGHERGFLLLMITKERL